MSRGRLRRAALASLLAFAAATPSLGGNQALVTGAFGGSLGAGGATAAERSALGQNPAALRPHRIGGHAHFHRPFGLSELQVGEVGVFADGSRLGSAFVWRETGVEGLYAEQALQAAQTLRLGRTGAGFPGVLDLGLSVNRWKSAWPGGRTTSVWSHGLGAAWRVLPRIKAGAFVTGLTLESGSAALTDRTDRVLQWGLEANSRDREGESLVEGQGKPTGFRTVPSGSLQSLRLDFRKTGETAWRVLASLSLSPHPVVEVTGGLASPPFQASMGIRIAWRGAQLHQAIRYHRYLGRTWLSGFTFSHPLASDGAP